MSKKYLSIAAFISLTWMLVAPASAADTAKAPPAFDAGTTMARLAAAGTVTVGTKFDQPLFGLKGLDGKPTGFDVEIAKIIAAGLGIAEDKINWVEAPSKVRDQYIIDGRVDFITATYAITDARRKILTFGGPYYDAATKLLVKANNQFIQGPRSFTKNPKLKVCTVIGGIDAEAVKPFLVDQASQLVQFDVGSKCAAAVRSGQVDAHAGDSATLVGQMFAAPGEFKVVGDAFHDQPFGVGIKKGDIKFCEFIDATLRRAEQDGRYAAAWKRTVGQAKTEMAPPPPLGPCE